MTGMDNKHGQAKICFRPFTPATPVQIRLGTPIDFKGLGKLT
jgi:hypothetical protein